MNINDIMMRDMAEAKKRAEIEEAERTVRANRRAEKIVNFGCAVLWVLAVATLALLAWLCVCDTAHRHARQRNERPELPITNCTISIGSPIIGGATGDLDCGDKKLTFTNGLLHAVSD